MFGAASHTGFRYRHEGMHIGTRPLTGGQSYTTMESRKVRGSLRSLTGVERFSLRPEPGINSKTGCKLL